MHTPGCPEEIALVYYSSRNEKQYSLELAGITKVVALQATNMQNANPTDTKNFILMLLLVYYTAENCGVVILQRSDCSIYTKKFEDTEFLTC